MKTLKFSSFKLLCLLVSIFSGISYSSQASKSFMGDIVTSTQCNLCNSLMPIVRSMVITGRTRNFQPLAAQLCLSFKISTDKQVCDQTVSIFDEIIFETLKSTTLTNEELCSAFLNCNPISNPIWNWNINLPNVAKPEVVTPVLPEVNIILIRLTINLVIVKLLIFKIFNKACISQVQSFASY
jgi:hypothetical protein